MKTTTVTIACIFCFACAHAQEPAKKRFNMMIDYSVGLQFLNLNRAEEINSWFLHNDNKGVAQGGWQREPGFGPTVLHHVGLAFSICRKRALFFELNTDWGKNEVTMYRYSTGKQSQTSNPARGVSRMILNLWGLGYGVKKEISLGKWGMLMPGISFHSVGGTWTTHSGYEVRDKNTGEVVQSDYNYGRNGYYDFSHRTGILMLLDNPRIGVDYKVKLVNHIYFKASYSYWLLGAMPNNLYGLSNKFVISFDGSHYYRRLEFIRSAKDFSHNLSVGLLFSLR